MAPKERLAVMIAMGVATGRKTYESLDPDERALFDGWGWSLPLSHVEPRERAEMIVLAAIFAAHEEDDGK